MQKPGKLYMGTAGRAHGIRGELAINWLGELAPASGQMLFLKKNGMEKAFQVARSRFHNDKLLVFLEGIADRTEAENWTGAEVFIDRESLPPLEEDEAWLEDLLGFSVYLESGEEIGILDHVEFPANQEIWSIKPASGAEILFPGQPQFIVDIDQANKKITIAPPPGLLEIYRA